MDSLSKIKEDVLEIQQNQNLVKTLYPLEEFKALPYEAPPSPVGRPHTKKAQNQISLPSSPAAEDGQARAEQSQPATL